MSLCDSILQSELLHITPSMTHKIEILLLKKMKPLGSDFQMHLKVHEVNFLKTLKTI